jgi:hypothetical protein
MDTGELRRAYNVLLAEVAAGGFGAPPAGQWSAERIVAHVAANDDLLSEVTNAVLAGDPRAYYNHDAVDDAQLDALIAHHGDLAGLATRLRATSERLCQLAERLHEEAATPVHTHIRDGAEVRVDQPVPWGRILELQARVHLAAHAEQLRALRRPPAAPGTGG